MNKYTIIFKIGENLYFGFLKTKELDINKLPDKLKIDFLFEIRVFPVQSKVITDKSQNIIQPALSPVPAGFGFLQKDAIVFTKHISLIKILDLEELDKSFEGLKEFLKVLDDVSEQK